MAAVGLAMVAVGGAIFALAVRNIGKLVDALPEALAREADARLGKLERAALVVAVAVLVYFVARQLGHGKIGLYVCIAMLVLNAGTVAFLRVRWFDALGASPDIARSHRTSSWAQAVGATIGFVGCAVYLLR